MLIYTTNGKTLIMADSIKLLCTLGLVSVRSVIHINYSIWFFHMTLGKIKKVFYVGIGVYGSDIIPK